jgi:hypothetical protein
VLPCWATALPSRAGTQVWGPQHHLHVRTHLGHGANWGLFAEDLPGEANRVELSRTVTDSSAIPAPEVHYTMADNARRMLDFAPGRLVVGSLGEDEAQRAVEELRKDPRAEGVRIDPAWGDIFVPSSSSSRPRTEMLADPEARREFIDDLYDELTDAVFERSALGTLLVEVGPDIVVDSVNTAGALAYQDVFRSAGWRQTPQEGNGPTGGAHQASPMMPSRSPSIA